MKRFTILATLFFVILVVIAQNSYSKKKEYKFTENKQFNEVLNEKLKVDIEELLNTFRDNPELIQKFIYEQEKLQDNLIQNSYEKVITTHQNPDSELSVAINPRDSNNMIMSVMRLAQITLNPITLPIFYTKNFGEKWQVSNFAMMPPQPNSIVLGGGDPMITFDANGIAHLTWISLFAKYTGTKIDSVGTGMHYAYSTNGGETWIYDFYKGISNSTYFSSSQINLGLLEIFDDKQWFASDFNPQSPNYGKTFITFTRFNQKNTSSTINSSVIDKDFKFTKPYIDVSQSVGVSHQFTSNSFGKNGRFIITFYALREIEGKQIPGIFCTYSDNGTKFTSPKLITNFEFVNCRLISSPNVYDIPGIDNQRIYPCVYNAADNNPTSKYYGNVYVVWSSYGINKPSTTKFNVYLSRSTDNGETWIPPIELSIEPPSGPIDQFYPSITVNPDGVVIVAWYEQQDDPANSFPTDYVLTYSTDGGLTFTPPLKLTQQSTKFTTIGTKNNKFGIGEYNQIVATKHYAIPFWSDGRLNDGDLNVYAAKVPLSTSGVTVDEIYPIFDNFMEIAPNPISNILNINFSNTDSQINYSIFNIDGVLIKSGETTLNNLEIDFSKYPDGTYLINAQKGGKYKLIKFQKN